MTHPRFRPSLSEDLKLPFATCIEGVAVQNSTPGFDGGNIVAIANASGPSAPKTNVARSALEDTAEHREMLKAIYSLYARHVSSEIGNLAASDEYSLSRAVSFAPFIASPLTTSTANPTKPNLLATALAEIPLVLIEDATERRTISLADLRKMDRFRTIESPLYRSIEYFVREAPADITAEHLLKVLGNRSVTRAGDPIVCNMAGYIDDRIREEFQISRVEASSLARNLSLTWEPRAGSPSWFSSGEIYEILIGDDPAFYSLLSEARERIRSGQRSKTDRNLNVPLTGVTAAGLDENGSFIASRERYLVPGTPLAGYLSAMYIPHPDTVLKQLASRFMFLEASRASGWGWDILNVELASRVFATSHMAPFRRYVEDLDDFIVALNGTSVRTFDSYAWERRGTGIEFGLMA